MVKNEKKIGIYPGTFDPITKGHLHIIKRASKLFDKIVVGVAANADKNPIFSLEERLSMVKTDIANMNNKSCEIDVKSFDNLLIHFAKDNDAYFIIRGLRAVSDFEYEFQLTGMNAKLAPDVETVFLMAADRWQFVSSSFVKEIHKLGGDMSESVTPNVLDLLSEKYNK